MGVREEILSVLERERGKFVSGTELARRLGVTRAAIWKAAEKLRASGYPIDAVPNVGYRLNAASDIVSDAGARKYLRGAGLRFRLETLKETGSTNDDARELANLGEPEGTTVVANCQRRGRGRMGRAFFSPKDAGVYLSAILRPDGWTAADSWRLTSIAAVAVCRAIETVADVEPKIKWVNDVLIDEKKVCGILTEASLCVETAALEFAIVGVGINARPPANGFPPELAEIATSVYSRPVGDGKNRLVAEFLNHFGTLYFETDASSVAEEYRRRSIAPGRAIRVAFPNGVERDALALDVDDECRLLVQYEDGTRATLASGEVRLKL